MNESAISALTTVGKKENAQPEPVHGIAAAAQPQQAQNDAAALEFDVDDNNFDGGIHDEGWHNDATSDVVPCRIEFKLSASKEKQAAKEPDVAVSFNAARQFAMDDESDIDLEESMEEISSPAGDAFFKSPDRSGRGAPKNRVDTVR